MCAHTGEIITSARHTHTQKHSNSSRHNSSRPPDLAWSSNKSPMGRVRAGTQTQMRTRAHSAHVEILRNPRRNQISGVLDTPCRVCVGKPPFGYTFPCILYTVTERRVPTLCFFFPQYARMRSRWATTRRSARRSLQHACERVRRTRRI